MNRAAGVSAWVFALVAATLAQADSPAAPGDLMSDTWVATDGLGRTLPDARECRPPQPGKFVGIFYFLWHGAHGYGPGDAADPGGGVVARGRGPYQSPYDITQILAADPEKPPWGPLHAFHHWGEPELGYYVADDEYVIRRHCRMLTGAGIDAVIFDVTNGFTYTKIYMNLCAIYTRVRAAGGRTPQVAFLAHTGAAQVVRKLYDDFYSRGLYTDLWFRWKGKPLMMAPAAGLDAKVAEFFTFRDSWAWTRGQAWFGDGRDKWPWLDHCPQTPGWHESPEKGEQVAVCPAEHPTSNIGRSFHDGREPPPAEQRPAEGLHFAEQWKRALEVDPEFIFITGWNEWVAQRFTSSGKTRFLGRVLPEGETFFVDQYTQEFSRDIEPMKGGHGDAYYYQMVAGIRRFKGVRPLPPAGPPKTIRIDGEFSDWDDVAPEYRDAAGDTMHRDHPGWGRIERYTDTTGRNDLTRLKAARDDRFVYFYAETKEKITDCRDPNWMLLFIDADSNPKTGWQGYDYLVNRQVPDAQSSMLEKYSVGPDAKGRWTPAGKVEYRAGGNRLEMAVPRNLAGMDRAGALQFDFHWADNIQSLDDVTEFALHGDSAPDRRFNYRYRAGP